MASSVIVRFQVEGVAQVQAAFKTVEQAAMRAEQANVAGARRVGQTQVNETKRAVAEQIAAGKALDAYQKGAVKEREKEEKQKARAADASAKEQINAMKRMDRFVEQARKQGLRDHEAGEKEKARVVAREAKKRVDAEIAAEEAGARRRAEIQRQFARALGHGAAQGLGNGIRQVYGVTSQAVQGILGLGGGYSIAQSIQERMSAEKSALLLSNAAFQEGGKGDKGRRVDSKDILTTARAAAIESGVDVNDLLDASHEYVARGSDLSGLMAPGGKAGVSNMAAFAKIAKVNSADVKDVFTAMGMLKAQNEDLGPAALQEMMLNVAAQGRHGAIELKDLSRSAARLGKNASNFAGDQGDRQRELLALAQIGIKASGSGAETATVISNFATYGAKNAATIGLKTDSSGRIISDAAGHKDMASIIGQVFEKAKGNVTLMGASTKEGGFGFGIRGNKLFQALAEDFQGAKAKALAGGADEHAAILAGRKAVEEKVSAATMAKGTPENLVAEHAKLMSTPAERLDSAFRKLRDATADKLAPAMEELIPVIEKMIPVFTDLIGNAAPAFLDFVKSIAEFANQNKGTIAFLASHPIGALIVGNITASLMKAAIGESVRTILVNLLKAAAGGGGGGGPLGAVGGVAMAGVAAGVATTTVIANAVLKTEAGTEEAANIAAKVRSGHMTPQAAQKMVDEAKGRLDRGSVLAHAADLAISPFSAEGERDYAKYKKDQGFIDSEALAKTIKEAMAKGIRDGMANNTPATDPHSAPRNGPVKPLNNGGASR